MEWMATTVTAEGTVVKECTSQCSEVELGFPFRPDSHPFFCRRHEEVCFLESGVRGAIRMGSSGY